MENYYMTISRQFGSLGRAIAHWLDGVSTGGVRLCTHGVDLKRPFSGIRIVERLEQLNHTARNALILTTGVALGGSKELSALAEHAADLGCAGMILQEGPFLLYTA